MPGTYRFNRFPQSVALVVATLLQPTLPAQEAAREAPLTKSVEGPEAATTAKAKATDTEIVALRKLYATIPTDFRGIPRARLDTIASSTYECRDRLQNYLSRHSLDRKNVDAAFMYARLRTSLAARERLEMRQEKLSPKEIAEGIRQYHRESLTWCKRALEAAGDDAAWSLLRCETRDLTGDIAFQFHDFELSLENYLEVIRDCPDFKTIGNTIVGAGRSYLELRRADAGITFLRKAIKERYRSVSLPFFYEVVWNLLTTKGDIDGMIAWCDEVGRVFPIRMLREGRSKIEQDAYRRFLGFSGFRLGYARFAKGDLSGAAAAFEKHIEELNTMEKTLDASKKSLPQELRIYRQRSMDVLHTIQERIGDHPEPECDLDLDDLWVTPNKVRLANSHGKAVVLLARGYDDKRSSGFLRNLDRHLGKSPENKAFVALHYLKGTKDPNGQLEKLQDEVIQLELENTAVGMDPDGRRKAVFRCLGAMVGSATCLIYDRYGRLMWWMQDPREMDSEFVIAIWERLAKK